jgi:two-component system phosphate regulon sensor histidine kinase PhoR
MVSTSITFDLFEKMKSFKLRNIILLIALALIGLVAIQIYWISNAVTLEKERIERAANEAVNEVVAMLERHETLLKIRSHQEAKYLFIQGEEDDVSNTSFPPDDSLVQYVVKKNVQRHEDRVEMEISSEHAGQKEEKTITYSLEDIPFSTDLEQELRLHMTTADSISLQIQKNSEALDQDISMLRDRLKSKKAFLGDIVKSLIEVNLDQPIDERIDLRVVDSLLNFCLKNHGLMLGFEFGVFDDRGEMVFGAEDHEKDLRAANISAQLFPSDIIQVPYFIKLYFPSQGSYIFDNLALLLIISLVLIVTLVWTSFYSIVTISNQKKNSEIKNDFINNMTHELKTPISTISLACEALADPELGKLESVKNRYLNIINAENKRLGLLVEEVLQSAVLDKGDFKLKREDIEMHQLIEEVVDKYQIQLKERNATLSLALKASNCLIEGDKNHLANVLYNLLDNAVKYSRANPEISISTELRNEAIIVSVKDSGIGISAENLKKIFDRLYRVPTGNVHNVKGFGLGLSYVKVITERHGGRVSVDSKLDEGSTFYIELPLKTASYA